MFVLGIDPGLTRCGFGVVSLTESGGFRAADAGILETPKEASVESRLGTLLVDLQQLIAEVKPDVVVVERVFFQRNAKTAIGVAQASGLAVGVAAAAGCQVRQFTAQEVKLAVTGYGAAPKQQVQLMVASLCELSEIPEPADAADALGLAITFLLTSRFESHSGLSLA